MQAWNEVLRLGPLTLEPGTRTAHLERAREVGPRSLDLSRLEFDVLLLLVRARCEPVSKGILLDAVWGQSNDVMEHAIEETVSTLRRKLGEARDLIRTVRGVGYAIALPGSDPCDHRRRVPRGGRGAR